MRLIVAGSRTFNDYNLLDEKLDEATYKHPKVVILTGDNKGTKTTKGADQLAQWWAYTNWYTCQIYHADWSKGKVAGPLRNREMAQSGSHLIAFWDEKSPGTKSMIEEAKKLNLKIRIVRF